MDFFPKTILIRDQRGASKRGASKKRRRSFMRDERGGITIFVLIISVLLLVAGGMCVDFQRQEMARADLQNALDRGVLAATNRDQVYQNSGPLSVDEQALQLISNYLASRNDTTYALNVSAVVSSASGGRTVAANADHSLDTLFLRMVGLNELSVAAGAGAIQAAPKLEITLVLDVSGSMGWDSTSAPGTKISQLKAAAKEFLEIVLTSDTVEQTLITIVPFSQQVTPPRSMADQYNLARDHDYSSCFDFHDLDFTTTAMPTNTQDPFGQGQHFIEYSGHYGCPGVNNAITPFSNNLSDLRNAIDALQPETYTATYMGMKWGAAMLDPASRPVVDAMIADNELSSVFAGWPHAWNDTTVRKITVLMSDGQNTKLNEVVDSIYNNGSPAYWDTNRPRSGEKIAVVDNARRGDGDPILADICSAARVGANSTIYTIGFELADQSAATAALESCASSLSTHYLVDGLEITTAFKNIADEIVNLKLIN